MGRTLGVAKLLFQEFLKFLSTMSFDVKNQDTWEQFTEKVSLSESGCIFRVSPKEALSLRMAALYEIRFFLLKRARYEAQGFIETIQALRVHNGSVRLMSIVTPAFRGILFYDFKESRIIGFLYWGRDVSN